MEQNIESVPGTVLFSRCWFPKRLIVNPILDTFIKKQVGGLESHSKGRLRLASGYWGLNPEPFDWEHLSHQTLY